MKRGGSLPGVRTPDQQQDEGFESSTEVQEVDQVAQVREITCQRCDRTIGRGETEHVTEVSQFTWQR
jgi:hypothetical protein